MAKLEIPQGWLPPGEPAEVYKRTEKGTGDGSGGHAGDIDGKKKVKAGTADAFGGLELDGVAVGPYWVRCGSHTIPAVVLETDEDRQAAEARSEAAKKAAATRRRQAKARSDAAKKAAATRRKAAAQRTAKAGGKD